VKKTSVALPSLLLCLALWALFSWPLPTMVSEGIPASAQNTEEISSRFMIPGDHLQFLYHFTLVSHFASGRADPFYNLYEFNRGTDEDRYSPGPYYAPFSLLFAALAPLTGAAAAWNLVGLFSLWITLWSTWALLRRYVEDRWVSGAAALISITLPFRWITLAGGSPTGLGMMWVPIAFLGLEVFIVDGRARGAFLAGLAVFLSSWVDDHVFFFVALAALPWILFAWFMERGALLPTKGDVKGWAKASWPLLLFAIPSAWQVLLTSRRLSGTDIGAGGRSLGEVSLFSPHAVESLVFWKGIDTGEIYLGIVAVALVAAGLAAALRVPSRRKRRRLAFGLAVIALAVTVIVFLAAGTNNPLGPRGWQALTTLIPPYAMIRSPIKIFLLMPTLVAVAAALAGGALLGGDAPGRRGKVLVVIVALAVIFDYRLRLRTQVSLLDGNQGAYEAVVADASASGRRPHIMALPLWPGNSHWTSVNQYYASLYGVRMINGYKPTVPTDYRREVFDVFEGFNKGSYPDDLLDDLLVMGIGHIVVHEDAYPEKVSPFGASHTIASLLAHPRTTFLGKDQNVWAFRIEKNPSESYFPLLPWRVRSSSRIWEFENYGGGDVPATSEPSASAGAYLSLTAGAPAVATPAYAAPRHPGIAYMLRLRGYGSIDIALVANDADASVHQLSVASENWDWISVPLPATVGGRSLSLQVRPRSGSVDADVTGLFMPDTLLPLGGKKISLPAPVFFHAGHTDIERGTVVLSPKRAPAKGVFYGPRVPLEEGSYTITVSYESAAPEGTLLGRFFIRRPRGADAEGPLVSGLPFRLDYEHPDSLLFSLVFEFAGKAAVEIGTVTLEKAE